MIDTGKRCQMIFVVQEHTLNILKGSADQLLSRTLPLVETIELNFQSKLTQIK
jgi:hypothetical protein